MKSEIDRQQALALKNKGHTFKEISDVLGITYDATRNLCQYKKVMNPRKRGAKAKIMKKDCLCIKRAIARFTCSGEKITSPKIKEETHLNVSTKTVRRHMTRIGAKYKRSRN